MGLFSSIKKEFKRAGRSIEKEAKRVGRRFDDELQREIDDVSKAASFGLIDRKAARQMEKEAKRARKEEQRIQKQQRRLSLIEDAEFASQIAERGRIAERGGRVGLLTGRGGERGSLLA